MILTYVSYLEKGLYKKIAHTDNYRDK